MIKSIIALTCVALVTGAAMAAPAFYDNFEAGVNGTNTWYNWGSSTWPPPNPSGINNLLTTSDNHNHTPGGTYSARATATDPAAWNAYSDFGATSETIRAEVWLFEDFSNDGTNSSQPVTNMLSLCGDGANPGVFSDYIQLGVVPFYPSGSARYGFRTRYNDNAGGGTIDTGVSRKAGWTQLAIEVDALTDGGQVRFFIDGAQVGTSYRAGANAGAGGLAPVDLRWVRLGNNSKSYENFWYDDVSVTPEPATAALLLIGACTLVARRRR
jgi:hypothetical protein